MMSQGSDRNGWMRVCKCPECGGRIDIRVSVGRSLPDSDIHKSCCGARQGA